jgi:RHS repeat-associated protein
MTTLQAQSSNTAARAEVTKYYAFNGSRAVMRQANNEVFYLFGDHLGSSSLVVDWQGRKISEMRYTPWGETRWAWELDGEGYTDRLYTSQRRESPNYVGSLLDYGARFFDSNAGRFISPDTLIPNARNPVDFNRYAYTRNNPLRYTDSSGHWIESALDIAGIVYDVADITQNGLNWENGLSLAADVAGLILPGITGGGVVVRAAFKLANRADVIGDVAKGATKLLGKLDDVAQGLDNAKTLISGKLGEVVQSVKKGVANGCSFSADTLVSTYDGLKPIAWVQTGEQVLAYNEATAATGYYTVTATWNHLDPVVTLLVMDGELIEATPEHPFFAPGVGWREAGKLWPGAPVRKADICLPRKSLE